MRLVEFYNPELDEFVKRSKEDTRKSKLTLEELGKLRKFGLKINLINQIRIFLCMQIGPQVKLKKINQ